MDYSNIFAVSGFIGDSSFSRFVAGPWSLGSENIMQTNPNYVRFNVSLIFISVILDIQDDLYVMLSSCTATTMTNSQTLRPF